MTPTRADYDRVMIPCYHPADLVMAHGKKSRLWDTEGRCYLDFGGGIAVNCLGNAPKVVRKALKKQSARLCHVSNIFANDATLKLAAHLTALTGFDRVFFTNSGAESNEAALKLARRTAFDDFGEKKDEIISFTHSFHGRTFFTVSVGGQDKYSSGFGPRPGAITHLPFNDIAAFEKQISKKTCAVIFEPVQGEGGVLPVDVKFAKRVRELCDKFNALLIMDEVQTGCGRSGTFFAFEQIGVRPDIVTTAKGLAGGVPIGCILTSDKIAQHFHTGTHGSTFGGNALACAVGEAVLSKISKPKFLANVAKKGQFFQAALKAMNEDLHVFSDVRGLGLLIGCELVPELRAKLGEIQTAALKAGLIVLTAGGTTIRIAPALNIKEDDIMEGVAILKTVLSAYALKEKPAAKATPAKKTVTKKTAAAKPAAKPAAKAQAKATTKTPAKAPAKTPAKAVVKKSASKSVAKSVAKPVAKSAVKVVKPTSKTATETAVKTSEKATPAKAATQLVATPVENPATTPDAKKA